MMAHRLLRFQDNFEALVTTLAASIPAEQRSEAQQLLLSDTQKQVAMLHRTACVLTAEPIAVRERRIAKNQRALNALTEQLASAPFASRPLNSGADLSLVAEHH